MDFSPLPRRKTGDAHQAFHNVWRVWESYFLTDIIPHLPHFQLILVMFYTFLSDQIAILKYKSFNSEFLSI